MRSPLNSNFTSTVDPLMIAFLAGIAIFTVGLALSCSPRAFIASMTFCGRGTTVRLWAPGGVAVVVAVVFALSFACRQPDPARSAAKQRLNAGKELLGILIASSNG